MTRMLRLPDMNALNALRANCVVRTIIDGKTTRTQPPKKDLAPGHSMSKGEFELWQMILADKMPQPEREYEFAKDLGRKWRADFCWPNRKLIVEVEGGTWVRGRHARGKGMQEDMDKYNAAARLGYMVLRFTTEDVTRGRAIADIKRLFKSE